MSTNQPNPQYQQGQPYTIQPPPPEPPPKKSRRRIPWNAVALVCLGILVGYIFGAAGGGTETPAASEPGAATTVTVPAQPGQKVTVPGPTKTVPGPRTTITAPPPAAKAAITEDGTYLVGSDIKPGTYRNGNEGDCYWARLRNTNGDLDSIIANGTGGNQVVTIKSSDKAFETTNCGAWRLAR